MTFERPITTLGELVSQQAARYPERTAILSEGRVWTYAELNRGICRSARLLAEGGVVAGDRVLMMAATSDAFVFSFFALQRLGAIPVPIHPHLQEVEVIALARDSGARWLLADMSIGDHVLNTFLQACGGIVIRMDPRRLQIRWRSKPGAQETTLDFLSLSPEELDEPAVAQDAIATILYAHADSRHGGGVCLTHRNLLGNAHAIASVLPVAEFPSTAIVLPLHHANALTGQLIATLLVGGRVQLFRNLAFAFPVLQAMQRDGIQSFSGVPTTFRLLANLSGLHELDLRCVRYVNTAGAPLRPDDLPLIQRVFPEATIYHHYGLTEAGPRVSTMNAHDGRLSHGAVGKPLPNVQVRIVQDGREVVPGQSGELEIQGPGVATRYWRMPPDAEAILRDGWLRTGDVARMDEEGYLYLLERRRSFLVSGGEKVLPSEVEKVLVSHPQVEAVKVLGEDDPLWGDRIVAYVVPSITTIDLSIIRAHGERHLAPYKWPHDYRLVDQLPD